MKNHSKDAIRVLLADDHPIVLTGFATSLSSHGISVVGQLTAAEDVLAQYQTLSPDILVLDIKFGSHLTGLDAAHNLLDQFPDANIVFLSQFDQDQFIKKAYKLGARAFVTKTCTPKELATALQRVHQGEIYFPPQIAERLASLTIRDSSPQSLLDERELEIFTMLARGLTNVEVAETMDLSAKTISNTSQTIKDKLGIHRHADMTLLAVKYGLVELN